MRKVTLFLTLLFVNSFYSQKIDYNNFDPELASKALFNEMNKFRDTITVNGYGAKFDSLFPETVKEPRLKNLVWSNDVYKTFSKPNCLENVKKNDLFHVDVTTYWNTKENRIKFLDDVFIKSKENPNTQINYSEVGLMSTETFETYEEMAVNFISKWEKSYMHRCIIRAGLYGQFHMGLGYVVQNASACYVYNSNGTTWAFFNFVY
jgi:hypothetical protein